MTDLTGDQIRPYEEPPSGMSSGSRLERALRAGKFAVTAELNPPDSADPADVFEAARPLSEVCDAINATDASGANCHMSSIGICGLLTRAGYGCLTGDGTGVGDQPGAKPVFDFDSLALLRTMRDDGVFLSGRPILQPPAHVPRCRREPCVPPYELRAERLAKKIDAGAEIIQTNYIFDLDRFERFMSRVRDLGFDKRLYILAGVGPLASAKAARWMRAHVPGIHIPDAVIDRLERSANPAAEGTALCIELMQRLREIPGVAGIHVMAYRREHLVSEIVLRSGVRG
jgi:methylenetetrahydrofolate reductase (NADH)